MFTFTVSHQNTFCVSISSNQHKKLAKMIFLFQFLYQILTFKQY